MYKKGIILFVLVSLIVFTGVSAAQETVVRIGHRWNTTHGYHLGLENAIKKFMQDNPDIQVKIEYGYNDDKYKVQILAGVGPDIIFVHPPVTWGANGLIQPLDRFIQGTVSAEDFAPAAWYQNIWDGKLWALPLTVDPNFALFWNTDAFNEVGLNPNLGPETLDDFEIYMTKLTRYNADGSLSRIGMVPWDIWGNDNTIYTWGWIFGGSFYDEEKKQVTAEHPAVVEALTYLRDYYEKYYALATPLSQGLPTGLERFSAGREAMRLSVSNRVVTYRKNVPQLNFNVGKMFYKPGVGADNPAWIGGWSLSMSATTQVPEATWRVIRHLSADPEGTTLYAQGSGAIPAYIKSPGLREFVKSKDWEPYVNIYLTSTRYRPAIPVQGFLNSELTRIFNPVMKGHLMPQDALKEVSQRVHLEWEELYGKR